MKNMRLIVIGVLALTLIGCMDKNPEKSKDKDRKDKKDNVSVFDSKPDYNKAAMLNVDMGEKYLAQGQVVRAKKKFMHALELKPKSPEVNTSVGYFYETVGDIKEAELHYRKAISYAEGSKGQFYNNYGAFLCRQERYKDADRAFNSAINDKQYLDTAAAFENAGLCCLKQGNMEKAHEYLETAVLRDPRLVVATTELANIEMQKNKLPLAKEYLDRTIAQGNDNSRVLWISIQLNRKLGKSNDVADAANKLKNKYPESAEYKSYLESIQHG